MPRADTTRIAFCHLLLFSMTHHARTVYYYLLSIPWSLDPSQSPTTIMAEFLPVLSKYTGTVPIPKDDNLVNLIVFLIYFHATLACFGIFIFGGALLVEMGLITAKRIIRREQIWLKDPLDILHPEKQNLFEQLFLTGAWGLFNIWSQLAVFLLMLSCEWDFYYLWENNSEELSVSTRDTSRKVFYGFLAIGIFMITFVTALGICMAFG